VFVAGPFIALLAAVPLLWDYGLSTLDASMALVGYGVINRARFAPDLGVDRDVRRVDRLFPLLVALSLPIPAVIGGLVTSTLLARSPDSYGRVWSGWRYFIA
jgi:hypothetical protein